jgi:hypothetical protein
MQALELSAHGAQAVRVAVRGDDEAVFASGANERRGFSAGRGAEIEDAVAPLHCEKQGHCLGSFVLD